MLKIFFKLLVLLSLGSCAHSVHMVHMSDFDPYIPATKGKLVSAKTEKFVILGITGSTSFVEEAKSKLEKQCSKGHISGVTTQYSTSLGFFSWTHKILMQGYCYQSTHEKT